jgi:CheY-like chemotaxis protein
MKILALDDDQLFLDSLKRMLNVLGHEVDCAEAAPDAIDMLSSTTYDFILVDYKMPEKDGIWFMKNATIPKSTKALLMTAYLNREVINQMMSLGACGYVVKPFEKDELKEHLEFHSGHNPA